MRGILVMGAGCFNLEITSSSHKIMCRKGEPFTVAVIDEHAHAVLAVLTINIVHKEYQYARY